MKYLNMTASAALAALLLMGCTKKEEPEGVIPQGYQDAVKKAGDLEGKLQGAAKEMEQDN